MAKQVKSLSGVKEHIQIKDHTDQEAPAIETIPTAAKCRFGAKLALGEKVTSIEITPLDQLT